MLHTLRSIFFVVAALIVSFTAPAAAAPEMFEASFIFHAWGNDISSGTASPYTSNDWTAAPLGHNCQHAEKYSVNGSLNSHYCSPALMQYGHPIKGSWMASIGTGTPPKITVPSSIISSPRITGWPPNPYWSNLQSWTYATVRNDAGRFFEDGGAAKDAGFNNRTGMQGSGTWHIRAGVNAFGGAMGLLGQYGAVGDYTITGKTGTYHGTSSWAMVPDIGRGLYQTQIDTGPMGTPIWQNPYSKTDRWYKTTPKGRVNRNTILAIGSGTLWTTGQVGAFAKTAAYHTSLYRTGYDNRTPGGKGVIQLVTPTLTHWLSPGLNTHTAQVGLLKIQVPEPGVILLFAAGAGALVWLRHLSRRC